MDMITAVQHSPTHTQMTFQFRVLPEYLNPSGTLHGASQSLFFDACTTMLLGPIARPPEFWTTYGTSRSLNVMYFRPAYEGDLLTLECEVRICVHQVCSPLLMITQTVNVSKRLALLRGVLKREDGALISTCEHQMYNVDADAVKL
jgi:acyl-coenzyme A thioesterase 13